MGESIQENVLKEFSANLALLMVVENCTDEAGWCYCPTNSSQSDQLTRRNEWDKTLHCEFEQRLLNYSNNYS